MSLPPGETTFSDPYTSEDTDDVQPPVDRRLVVFVLALVAIIFCWLLYRLLTSDWRPIGDYRTLQLRVADVGGSETPIVGVYSRYGWNHPGPLLFYVLALPYRLTGSSPIGLLLGALLVNLAAVSSTLWIAARAGTRALVLVGFFVSLLCLGMNPAGLADPWNPTFVILSVFACAVACWRLIFGDRIAAIVLVLFGSFAVQSHIGSALPVAFLLGTGATALAARSFRGSTRTHDRRTGLVSLVIAVVCWIPPLIDQLTNSPGNIRLIGEFLRDPPLPATGFATGIRIAFRFFSIPGNWVRGAEPTMLNATIDTSGWAIPWALIALGGASWWAWRQRWRNELILCALAGGLVLSGAIAASRIAGTPLPYLLRWMWPIAAFTWLAVGAVVLRQLSRSTFGRRQSSNFVVIATILVLITMLFRGVNLTPLRLSETWTRAIAQLTPPTLEAIKNVPDPIYVVDGYGIDGSAGLDLLAIAEENEITVHRGTEWAYIYGNKRTMNPNEAATILLFFTGSTRLRAQADPANQEIVTVDPLSPEERAEFDAIVMSRTSDLDLSPSLSLADATLAREERIQQWSLSELASTTPSEEFKRYLQLLIFGEIVTVFITEGPAR
ncbi:MAG: hypothetical protein WEA11_05660 [Acidimicrobiales bacterium]